MKVRGERQLTRPMIQWGNDNWLVRFEEIACLKRSTVVPKRFFTPWRYTDHALCKKPTANRTIRYCDDQDAYKYILALSSENIFEDISLSTKRRIEVNPYIMSGPYLKKNSMPRRNKRQWQRKRDINCYQWPRNQACSRPINRDRGIAFLLICFWVGGGSLRIMRRLSTQRTCSQVQKLGNKHNEQSFFAYHKVRVCLQTL